MVTTSKRERWAVKGAVEGVTDEAVWRRLLDDAGLAAGDLARPSGKTQLRARIGGYNKAAAYEPWLVLVDLDNEPCPAALVSSFLPSGLSSLMRLRVAVREVESWLLADHDRVAQSLGIVAAVVPAEPEREVDPKVSLINLARRSTDRGIQRDLVPEQDSGRQVGPGYSAWLQEFVSSRRTGWRPAVAEKRAPSLRRCRAALRALRRALDSAGGRAP